MAIQWRVNDVLDKNPSIKSFIQLHSTMFTPFLFKLSTTHIGKGRRSQIPFPGRIHYNFVSYIKFEV